MHTRPNPFGRLRLAGVRDKRKPMFLFLLSGLLLLRYAERQFVAGLFHAPPRSTRIACPLVSI